MSVHPLAGSAVPSDRITDVPELLRKFTAEAPDPRREEERVSFGTSGHRGSSLECTFNQAHILAICQAIAEYRVREGISGPIFLGKDTHALSGPAFEAALEVFAGNGLHVVVDESSPFTPTPVLSHAILSSNRGAGSARSDGVVVTPSHNPPEDGGIKYNPPSGGPADTEITSVVEARANALLEEGPGSVQRVPLEAALSAATMHLSDLREAYVKGLSSVLDMDAISGAGLRIGVDPLGGASVDYWETIAGTYDLDIEVVNPRVDPTFSFMPLDRDGRIRMDCSSPYAMSGLVAMKDRFDIACGLDPDADRHGIVTPDAGLMNPNHYLAVAVWYLFRNRPGWSDRAGVGKTLVSSSMIDRIAAHLERPLVEVPVGFKWFVSGLRSGQIAFAGEESAGATFLRRDATPWTTDKDGILLCLLAAEITAKTGRTPAELYRDLEERFGSPAYDRIDAPATGAQKAVLKDLSPEAVSARQLGGEDIIARLTRAPGNDAPLGGLKVVTRNGWFAARPSGTEDVYKIYAESFRGEDHLLLIQEEAREIVDSAFRRSPAARI